jgi:hypothetical protein
MFQNNLRFHLTELGAEFEEKADLGKLAQDLLDRAGQSPSGSPISGPAPR